MTLIVYKDGILAGDTRTSISRATNEPTTCGYCEKETHMVNDGGTKLTIFRNGKATFRGEKIIAMGAAGRVPLIRRLTQILKNGGDLETQYAGYVAIMGEHHDRGFGCSLLLVCAEHCYVIHAESKGALKVTQEDRSATLAIGSQQHTVKWMSNIMKSTTAMQIINVTMAMTKGIGGEIHFIDFTKPDLVAETAVKAEPMEVINNLSYIYEEGERSVAGQIVAVKALHKKPSTRKPVAKKQVAAPRTRKAITKKT